MLITTKAVYDIDGNLLEWEGYEYDGEVELCKGGASKAEQAAADAQRQQENQLMQQQLQMQQQQLAGVNATLDPMIAQGGLDPRVEAAMRTQAMNQTGQSYMQGIGNINAGLVARGLSGGSNAGGGAVAGNLGQFNAMQNALQSNLMTNIQMQKQSALMNELGMKMGIGSQYGANVGGFNQGAASALNSGITAAHNVDQASTGLWGSILGGALGLGSSIATGGMSNLGKGVGFFGGGAGAGGGGV